jgi:hypothetical protein
MKEIIIRRARFSAGKMYCNRVSVFTYRSDLLELADAGNHERCLQKFRIRRGRAGNILNSVNKYSVQACNQIDDVLIHVQAKILDRLHHQARAKFNVQT